MENLLVMVEGIKMKILEELKYQKKWVNVFQEHKPRVAEYWQKIRGLETIRNITQIDSTKKILDIGCGISSVLHFLPGERIGIDPLANVYKTIYNYPSNIGIIQAPAEDIPFKDNYFDIVFSSNSLDHCDNVPKVMQEVKRVLKPYGKLVVAVEFFKQKEQRTEAHPYCFTLDDIYYYLTGFKRLYEQILPWIGLREWIYGKRDASYEEILIIARKK